MPPRRTSLGGFLGGGSIPQPGQPLDIGAALQGLASGASSLLGNIYLRKVAERNFAVAQQQAEQARSDRAAQLDLARTRETREGAYQQEQLKVEREKLNQPKPARVHYDAQRGVMVNEDTGIATPVQNLPPAPTKEGQAHYDASRGVFVHPDGTVTRVRGLPAPTETPAQRRAANAEERAIRAAERSAKLTDVTVTKGAVDEALREVPRPSTAIAKDETAEDAAASNPAFQRLVADSLAYERSTLGPARIRYRQAVNTLAGEPGAPPTPTAPPSSAPAPVGGVSIRPQPPPVAPAASPDTGNIDLRTPPGQPIPRVRVPSAVRDQNAPLFERAATAYRAALAVGTPETEARARYDRIVAAIAARRGGQP